MLQAIRLVAIVLLAVIVMPAQAHGRNDFAAGVTTTLIVGAMLQQPSPVVGVTIGGPGFYYHRQPTVILPPPPNPVVCNQVYDYRIGQWVMVNCRETVHFRAPRPNWHR